jgi:hypothetical protein
VAYLSEPIYQLRQRASSLTHSFWAEACKIHTATDKAWKEFASETGSDGFKEAIAENMICVWIRTLQHYFCCKRHPGNLKGRAAELRNFVNTTWCETVLQEADPKKLSGHRRILFWAIKTGSPWLIFLVYWAAAVRRTFLTIWRKQPTFFE